MKTPEIGSRWQHRNGNVYTVLHIANLADEERYPKTSVYQGPNGMVWTRRADDWHRSMTPAMDPAKQWLLTILDQVDYTAGACTPNEMVGAVLPREVIAQARAAASGK